MDWIDELVSESLKADRPANPLMKCDHCSDMWHGLPRGGCEGPFQMNVEAIQNQGVLDWTETIV